MDPITAIGLASSIVAFVDYGFKVVKGAAEIYSDADGALAVNASRQTVVEEMRSLSRRLQSPDAAPVSGEHHALCVLATECHKISSDLVRLLESLKPAKANSKSHSLRASLIARFKDSERRDLEKRLDNCRAQLTLHLNFANIVSVDQLSDYVRESPETLAALRKQVAELSALVYASGLATSQLVATQKQSIERMLQESILASLAFEDMRHRGESISIAHKKTFEWIFDDSVQKRHDALTEKYDGKPFHQGIEDTLSALTFKIDEQEKFLSWMSSGAGVFHISGKMGSGKSTLMKFLGSHDETRERLQEWAGEQELVMACFYFWRAGSPLQKSLFGLYRSLLHDTLKVQPEYIPQVFPQVWESAAHDAHGTHQKPEICEKDIFDGFERLVDAVSSSTKHRFCFFVDGLDEYDASGSWDGSDMARQLKVWAGASHNIKFCVSSREHNEFMECFPSYQRVRLHELTRHDIQEFVDDRLKEYYDYDACDIFELADAIVNRASGIFMWVSVVVRGVRDQLRNDVHPDDILDYIKELPDELFQLYAHIVASMDKYTELRLIQTLAMVRCSSSSKLILPAYYFLNHYNANVNFARENSFSADGALPKDRYAIEETARRRVTGWCQGLVEVQQGDSYWDCQKISFSHLSVLEYITESPYMRDRCTADVGICILSELNLAYLKLDVAQSGGYPSKAMYKTIIPHIMMYHPPFAYIRSIDDIVDQFLPAALSQLRETPLSEDSGCPGGLQGWACSDVDLSATVPRVNDILHWNATAGLEYCRWKYENDPRATNTRAKVELLFLSICYTRFSSGNFNGSVDSNAMAILESLFERQLITPDQPFSLFREPHYRHMVIACTPAKTMSVWQFFLAFCVGHGQISIAPCEYRFIELFIANGADPSTWITIRRRPRREGHSSFGFAQLFFAVDEMPWPPDPDACFIFGPEYLTYTLITAHAPVGYSIRETLDFTIYMPSRNDYRYSMPLRHLVEGMAQSPEQSHCLEVIHRRIQELEDVPGMDRFTEELRKSLGQMFSPEMLEDLDRKMRELERVSVKPGHKPRKEDTVEVVEVVEVTEASQTVADKLSVLKNARLDELRETMSTAISDLSFSMSYMLAAIAMVLVRGV